MKFRAARGVKKKPLLNRGFFKGCDVGGGGLEPPTPSV